MLNEETSKNDDKPKLKDKNGCIQDKEHFIKVDEKKFGKNAEFMCVPYPYLEIKGDDNRLIKTTEVYEMLRYIHIISVILWIPKFLVSDKG